jgi:signal transduction histidine kinase
MTGIPTIVAIGVAQDLLFALVWAVAAYSSWKFVLKHRPQDRTILLFPLFATAVSLSLALSVSRWLSYLSPGLNPALMVVAAFGDTLLVIAPVLFRHMLFYYPLRARPPSRVWLTTNYGLAGIVAMGLVVMSTLPFAGWAWRSDVYGRVILLYLGGMWLLVFLQMIPVVRRGAWRSGFGRLSFRRADVIVSTVALIMLPVVLLLGAYGVTEREVRHLTLDLGTGIAATIPIAVRFLGELVRASILLAAVLAGTILVIFVEPRLADSLPAGLGLRAVVRVGLISLLVLVFAQPWMREGIERLVFRRSYRRGVELQEFLRSLTPDQKGIEICRRALAYLVQVMQPRGAAIVLQRGEIVKEGSADLGALERLWPHGAAADALDDPAGDYLRGELAPELSEALSETDVVAILPVASPQRRRGHLLMTAGLLGAYYRDEDIEAMQGFCNQLALLLDAAELLERTITVERSLAHAEKLATIGETASRIAHEIRNPITAARSLAQQLTRSPAARGDAEAVELILGELQRVERQVADLLRFSRREELQLAAVDLGELLHRTVGGLRQALDEAGVEVAMEAPAGIVAHADREKIRQVLLNLIENALDALREHPGARRLALVTENVNGRATLRVSDTGPGIAPEDLPRLFEPFFSRKEHGTGLGLAIVKRTIDAHGGRIEAASEPGTGTTFRIELPVTLNP